MKEYKEIETFAKTFLVEGDYWAPKLIRGFADRVNELLVSQPTCREMLLFLPARTDTHAFKEVGRTGAVLCMIHGRVRFPGQKSGAPFPSMLAYLGERRKDFVSACKEQGIGDCYVWDHSVQAGAVA